MSALFNAARAALRVLAMRHGTSPANNRDVLVYLPLLDVLEGAEPEKRTRILAGSIKALDRRIAMARADLAVIEEVRVVMDRIVDGTVIQ